MDQPKRSERRLPWWFRPSEPEVVTHGAPGEGKVLVVTVRDADGEVLERAWVDEQIAWQWDDTRWRSAH